MRKTASSLSLLASMLLASAAGSALAQEKIPLRMSTINPATSVYEVQGSQFLMKRITELTGGAVTFEYYPAGQLAKPEKNLSILESGVADIAYVGSAYDPDKLPLTTMLELPGLYSDTCQGARVYNAAAKEGKAFLAHDWAPDRKYKLLFLIPNAPSSISTGTKEVKTPKDMAGLKIRVAGAGSSTVVTALGGVPVRISAGDTYQSFQRGTVDGVMWSWNAHVSYDTHRISKFTTAGMGFGGTGSIWVINKARWDALPANVQKAIEQASNETVENMCKAQEDELAAARKKMTDAGVTVTTIDAAGIAAFQQVLAPIVDEWSKNLEAKGVPGKQALEEFKSRMTAR